MLVFVAGGTGVVGRRLAPQLVARGLHWPERWPVTMMTEGRGFSNATSKRELGWVLRYPSWRQGFKAVVA
jgi:uncharacterized protein YbjT (DUF2867 family)